MKKIGRKKVRILPYARPAASTSGSLEKNRSAGSRPTYRSAAATIATRALKTMVCSTTRLVLSWSPEPMPCVIRATEELPMTSLSTSTSQNMDENRVTPATALLDIRPTHIRSITSYRVCPNMPNIVGTDMARRLPTTLPFVRSRDIPPVYHGGAAFGTRPHDSPPSGAI